MVKRPIYFLCLSFFSIISCQLFPAPRGVPLDKRPLYDQAGKSHFQCLDNSMTIPFDWVNDDYCDCKDGSDEPGTSACSNGRFYCLNLGYRPQEVLSSRVNDQICDCCDGSDEWAGHVKCQNFCEEAGKAAKEEAERLKAVQREGFEKRKELVRVGLEKKAENMKNLELKKSEKEELAKRLEELDMVKQVAEKSEKEAKDIHTDLWKAELEAKNKIKQIQKATAAFEDLDVNKDKKLTHAEMVNRIEFDKNLDGQVTEEEITEYFAGQKETELEHFINEVWTNIKHIYRPPITENDSISQPSASQELQKPIEPDSSTSDQAKPTETEEKETETEDEVKEDDVDDFEKPATEKPPIPLESEDEEEKMPDFDENTKKLIADADLARKEYNDVDSKIRDLDNDIKNLDNYLKLDLGPEDEYAPFYKQCFEFHDPQYVYGLCLFDRIFQRSKDGGSDTSLGSWDSWVVSDGVKYSVQHYTNGMSCWNGPSRSTKVKISCGSESKLMSASEPGRCEYEMDFQTPAACKKPQQNAQSDEHSEL